MRNKKHVNDSCDSRLSAELKEDRRIIPQRCRNKGRSRPVSVQQQNNWYISFKKNSVVCREQKCQESQHLISCRKQQPGLPLNLKEYQQCGLFYFPNVSSHLKSFTGTFLCRRTERTRAAWQHTVVSEIFGILESQYKIFLLKFSLFITRTTTHCENHTMSSVGPEKICNL